MKARSALLLALVGCGLVLSGCCPLCRSTRPILPTVPAIRIEASPAVPTIVALLSATPPPVVATRVSEIKTAAPTVISKVQRSIPDVIGTTVAPESVTVLEALSGSRVKVERSNGERWILTHGAKCTNVASFVGKKVDVRSLLIFGVPGSRLYLPGSDESCEITNREKA